MWAWRRRIAVATLWTGVRLGLPSDAVAAPSDAADPPTPSIESLAGARALFAEALRDEQAKRFADALGKFQRVRGVRDTAAVEYRVGACHEGLGERALAYAAYRRAIGVGRGDPKSAEIVAAARERLEILARQVALLTLVMPAPTPDGTEVRVDDAPISREDLAEPLPLPAGVHVVTATAPDRVPARSEITLSEGATVSIALPLDPRPPRAATPSAPASLPVAAPSPPSVDASAAPTRRTAGWITVGGGGALLVGSAILVAVRAADISTLTQRCPDGFCMPGANQADLQATHDRAVLEGPVAIALGAAGLVAAGIGAYLVLTSGEDAAPAKTASIAPWVSHGAGGVVATGRFP